MIWDYIILLCDNIDCRDMRDIKIAQFWKKVVGKVNSQLYSLAIIIQNYFEMQQLTNQNQVFYVKIWH